MKKRYYISGLICASALLALSNNNLVHADNINDSQVTKTDSQVVNTDSQVTKTDSQVVNTDSKVTNTDSKVTKTDSQVVKTDNQVVKTDNQVAKNDNQTVKTDSQVTKTDSQVAKTDSQVDNTDNQVAKNDNQTQKLNIDKNVNIPNNYKNIFNSFIAAYGSLALKANLNIIDEDTGKILNHYSTYASETDALTFNKKYNIIDPNALNDSFNNDFASWNEPDEVLEQVNEYEKNGYTQTFSDYHPFYDDSVKTNYPNSYWTIARLFDKDAKPDDQINPKDMNDLWDNGGQILSLPLISNNGSSSIEDTENSKFARIIAIHQSAINALSLQTRKEFQNRLNNFIKYSNYNEYPPLEGTFTIKLKHNKSNVDDKKEIKEIIHYVDTEGNKLHDDYVTTTTFTRTGVKDDVTGNTIYSDYTPDKYSFAAVTNPEIDGYFTDTKQVNEHQISPSDNDYIVTVVYTKKRSTSYVGVHEDTSYDLPKFDLDKLKKHETGPSTSYDLPKFDLDKLKTHETGPSTSYDLPKFDLDKPSVPTEPVTSENNPATPESPNKPESNKPDKNEPEVPKNNSDTPESPNKPDKNVPTNSVETKTKHSVKENKHTKRQTRKIKKAQMLKQKRLEKLNTVTKSHVTSLETRSERKTNDVNKENVIVEPHDVETNVSQKTMSTTVKHESKETLPQTGEGNSSALAILGSVLSVLSFGLFTLKKKEN